MLFFHNIGDNEIVCYIDRVQLKNTYIEQSFYIYGWAFHSGGKEIQYDIQLDGVSVPFEMNGVLRADVEEKYSKYLRNSRVGFVLSVKFQTLPKSIQFFAEAEGQRKKILDYNEKKILEIEEADLIDSYIDYFKCGDNNELIVTGWAYSLEGKNINYKLFDQDGQEIEFKLQKMSRADTVVLKKLSLSQKYCGFQIKFKGDKKQTYILEFDDGEHKRQEKLFMSAGLSVKTFKNYLSYLEPSNLNKSKKFINEYGMKRFLKRLSLGPNAGDIRYQFWFEDHKATEATLEKQRNTSLSYNPKISIIVATFNTKDTYLKDMIETVIAQTYINWELCIADGSSTDAVENYIREHYSEEMRIKFKKLDKNYGISGNMNGALEMAEGDYIALYDHDDMLTPDCLFEFVSSMQEVHHDCLYSDEDKFDDALKIYTDPHFKPDFSIDLLRSHNYITHFFAVKKSIVDEVGGMRPEYDGSQDYDFIFRCIEKSKSIYHVPKILYHWRMHPASTAQDPASKMYCYDAGKRAIEAHLKRCGVEGSVTMLDAPLYGMYHVRYKIIGNPLISVIIPNKDETETLKTCIESLEKINVYKNIEIIVVENNSTTPEIFEYYHEVEDKYQNVRVITWKDEFNYSAINNFAVTFAKGEYLLFLNNDVEIINEDAIEELLGCAQRKEVGAVGAKLLYPDNTVQHAGVVVGYKGYATHAYTEIDRDDFGHMGRPRVSSNYSAVTAACLMVRKEIYDKVDGFDEQFKVACNDVDFCLKIRKLGLFNVFNAFSLWHHFESKTRGYEDTPEKLERFNNEIKKFQEKWPDILKNGDPFHNINFNLDKGPFKLY